MSIGGPTDLSTRSKGKSCKFATSFERISLSVSGIVLTHFKPSLYDTPERRTKHPPVLGHPIELVAQSSRLYLSDFHWGGVRVSTGD